MLGTRVSYCDGPHELGVSDDDISTCKIYVFYILSKCKINVSYTLSKCTRDASYTLSKCMMKVFYTSK